MGKESFLERERFAFQYIKILENEVFLSGCDVSVEVPIHEIC